MANKHVKVINNSQHQLEVLVQDRKAAQERFTLEPGESRTKTVAKGEVYVKLFKPGQNFGMMLSSADVTATTVQSGSDVEVIDGVSWAVIKKEDS